MEISAHEPAPASRVLPAESSMIGWTQAIYALHAFSLLMGILGAATIVGSFLTGWPSIIAVVLNYVKRGDVRGTWLESHFRWQIRTFWFALLWAVIIGVLGALLVIVVIGFAIWVIGLFVLGLWAIYRIARGWLRLRDRQPVLPA
jgi:uncharacterized membrane protein